jgi:hypothetical protein
VSESVEAEAASEDIDCVARLGGRRVERPILITFTSFSKKPEVLKNTRNLVGSKNKVDEDVSTETRRIRKKLIPYLKYKKK